MYWIPSEDEVEKKEAPAKPSGLMFACIERTHGITFCNRCPESKEFLFSPTAIRHIIAFYDPRAPRRTAIMLRACIACFDEAKEKIAKEDQWRLG